MAKKPIAKGIVVLGGTRYEARVKYKGKSIDSVEHSLYVGVYDTLDEAIAARNQFIIDLF